MHKFNIMNNNVYVTYENCQGKNRSKTNLENPGSLLNPFNSSVSAMP